MAGPWERYSSPDTQTDQPKGPWEKYGAPTETKPEPQKDTSVSKGFAYGAENAIRGLSATSKFLGAPKRNMADRLADMIHQDAGLDDYAPAGAVVGDSSKGVGERLMSAPRALVEGAPGLATDLVAGAVAGPAGFLASNAGRNFGQNVEAAQGNIPKALGVTAADAILARLGARATVGSHAKNLVRAAGTDAGVGAAQTILDKDILTGETSTPGDIAVNALTGAGVGVAGKAADAIVRMPKTPESMKDRKFNPVTDALNQDSLGRVSTALNEARTRGSADDYNYAFKQFDNATKLATKDSLFKAQLKEDPDLGRTVEGLVTDFNGRLKDGQVLTESDIGRLDTLIGHTDEGQSVIRALTDRNTLNQLTPLYDGGLSQSKLAQKLDPNTPGFNPIRSVDFHTLWRALRGQGIGLPEIAVGAAQLAAKPITKGIDRLTGAADPSKVLIDRFAGTQASPTPVGSFGETLAARALVKAQNKENEAKAKADEKILNAKTRATQGSFNATLDQVDRFEAGALKQQQKDATQAAKDKQSADADSLKRVLDQVKALKINFLPQSERFGRDMAEPASLPENPGYGTASPVNPKDLAFNALLAQKLGIKDLDRISQFDNANPLTDPSQIPLDDPKLAQLAHFIRKKQDANQERAYVAREVETEKAMKALGINSNTLPTPDVTKVTRGDMTEAFPDPKLLRPEMPPMAEGPARSDNLSRIDEILSGRTGRPKARTVVEEAMTPRKEAAKASAMEEVIRDVERPKPVTRKLGKGQWPVSVTADKIQQLTEDGKPDFDRFFRGVETKILQKEKLADDLKSVLNERYHGAVDKLLKKFTESGNSKELAERDFTAFVDKLRLAASTKERLNDIFRKSKLNTVRHWE